MPSDEESSQPDNDVSSDVSNSGRSRLVFVLSASFAIVVIGVLAFLFAQASADKTDAEGALEETEISLEESEQVVANLEDQLSLAQDQESELKGEISTLESDLDESGADLAAAEQQLTQADELTQTVIDFLGASISMGFPGVERSDGTCLAVALIEEKGAAGALDIFVEAVDDPENASLILGLGAAIIIAADSCGIPAENLIGAGTTADRYGDDPELDSLWDACDGGSGVACDNLFFISPSGSEYEEFGATCGDRFSLSTAPLLCEGEI